MKRDDIASLIVRYFILLIVGLNIDVIYSIFTPITVNVVYFILNAISGAYLVQNNSIIFKSIIIELVPACIAGSAYYLLLVLNLSTKMSVRKRAINICFLMVSFLVLNVIRIVFLSFFYFYTENYFDITHKALWYMGSTLAVVGVWFLGVWIFKIKEIPIYGDLSNLARYIKRKNN